jgi:hypothetical protein
MKLIFRYDRLVKGRISTDLKDMARTCPINWIKPNQRAGVFIFSMALLQPTIGFVLL